MSNIRVADPRNNIAHHSANIGYDTDGISAEWMELWVESEIWHGDPRAKESHEQFKERMMGRYTLTHNNTRLKGEFDTKDFWTMLWLDIQHWYLDIGGESGRNFLLRVQKTYSLVGK